MTEVQPVLGAFEKISACPPFAAADSLRNLLSYLVQQHLERPGEPIREAQIAAEVYGKTTGFDPRQDSTVRVQTSRLRAKLGEYYAGEGRLDEWVIEVPKGTYMVSVRQREVVAEVEPVEEVVAAKAVSPWVYAGGGFAAGVVVTLLVVKLAL
jgi:hypothetical protein